jgi:transcriptional regulator with XRE-family HTH domain
MGVHTKVSTQQKGGNKMSVGQKLRSLRGDKTQQFVADQIGVSLSAYIKYERDERGVRDEVKKRIANLYGLSIESIFFS